MTQQTLDPGTQPGGPPDEAASAKPAGRTRRRTSNRGRGAAKLVPPAAEPQAITQVNDQSNDAEAPSAPASREPTPVAEAAPASHEAEATATVEATAPAPARRSRARRGRAGAHRDEAQSTPAAVSAETALPVETAAGNAKAPSGVSQDRVAAHPWGEPGTAQTAPPEAAGEGTPEPLRTVPALTPESWPAPQPEAAETPTAAAAQSTSTRYRFRKPARTPAVAPVPVRPERIGGQIIAPAPQAPEERGAAEQAFEAPEPAPAHPASQVSPDLGELLERLGQREPEPALETLMRGVPEVERAAATEVPEPRGPLEGLATEGEDGEEASPAESEPAAGRRRRRRGRRSHAATSAPSGTLPDERGAGPEAAEAQRREATLYPPISPVPNPYAGVYGARETENGFGVEYALEDEPYAPYPERETDQGWSIASAQQQMREPRSPFVSPEPAHPRGFGPQPAGVAGPARDVLPRTARTARPDRDVDFPPMSANQLGAVITQAIQRQTDRLLTEMRHAQHPPSMTVMMPAYPSTERVGVFVDVANLIFSARNLRLSLDFGRMLEFLRGNRRIIRAHAYAPTNPDPNADQAFLQAVKGLGYRITTKNYKTFASGAKKADMDLDLCMDIVRLVDAGALDTVVLVSGDSDFLPLLEYCSDHGVRVEVAAFEDSAAAILRQSCDLFINLSLVDDIRA